MRGLRGCLILRLALLGGIKTAAVHRGGEFLIVVHLFWAPRRAPSVSSARNDRHLRRRLGWSHVQELLTAEVRVGSVWKVYNVTLVWNDGGRHWQL